MREGNELKRSQRGFREGPASWAKASPLLGPEKKTENKFNPKLPFPGVASHPKGGVLWKYQLVKWDSLENMIGKVKKYTTTHDGEMTSPTHVLLPMGIRKNGVSYCFL